MRFTVLATLTALCLGSLPSAVDAMPLAASAGLSPSLAAVSSMRQAGFVCRRGHWGESCWWAYSGSGWPPTWRGSGWRGPGWYGANWRKHYFSGYASRS